MVNITEEELTEVNTLRAELGSVVQEVGNYTLDQYLLEKSMGALRDKLNVSKETFATLLSQEEVLVNRLREKYGIGSINFETGEFTPEK